MRHRSNSQDMKINPKGDSAKKKITLVTAWYKALPLKRFISFRQFVQTRLEGAEFYVGLDDELYNYSIK